MKALWYDKDPHVFLLDAVLVQSAAGLLLHKQTNVRQFPHAYILHQPCSHLAIYAEAAAVGRCFHLSVRLSCGMLQTPLDPVKA